MKNKCPAGQNFLHKKGSIFLLAPLLIMDIRNEPARHNHVLFKTVQLLLNNCKFPYL